MTRIRLEISKEQALILEDSLSFWLEHTSCHTDKQNELNKYFRYMLFKVTHSRESNKTFICDKTGIKAKGVKE